MRTLHFYIPEHYRIEELVPQNIFLRFRDRPDFLWSLFNPHALWTADRIREHYRVPMLCNTWLWGGRFHGRGYRPDGYEGAEFSAHKRGCAIDLWPRTGSGVTGKQIQDDIIAYSWWEPFQYITCVEVGVNHLHFDLRAHDRQRLGVLQVRP